MVKKGYKRNHALTVMKKMEKRNFETFYAETKEDALALVLSLMPKGSSVSHGGTMTLPEIGLSDEILRKDYNLIDRSAAKNPKEVRSIIAKAMEADTFLMSANAISDEGEIINIDGIGNRVALLAYGPDQVILICGMNKVGGDRQGAIYRARNVAAPMNTVRLNLKTSCSVSGICSDCHSPDCICSQIVLTRHNRTPGRIKVILVGEDLGY